MDNMSESDYSRYSPLMLPDSPTKKNKVHITSFDWKDHEGISP